MTIYDRDWNIIEVPDLTLGRLEDATIVVHHDAVEPVEEVWHYEVVAEYPNGGKDLRKVIDVPGVEARDAYDEVVPCKVYIPYEQEDLDEMHRQEGPDDSTEPTHSERIESLEEQNTMLMECLLEMSEVVYQ